MPVEGDQPYALLFGTPGLLSLLRGTPKLLDGPLALVLHAPVVARADKGVDVVLGPFARRRRASDVPVQGRLYRLFVVYQLSLPTANACLQLHYAAFGNVFSVLREADEETAK